MWRWRSLMTGRHRRAKTSRSTATAAKVAITGVVLGSSSGALASQAVAATDSEFDQESRCDSGGNWATNTGNGDHGGLPFTPAISSTNNGGEYASEAQQATNEQQIAVAERVLAHQGKGAGPVCGGTLSGSAASHVPLDAPGPVVGSLNNSEADDAASTPLSAVSSQGSLPANTPTPSAPVEAQDVAATPPAEQDVSVDPPAQPQPPAPIAEAEPGDLDAAPTLDTQADTPTPQDTALWSPPTDQASSAPPPQPAAQLVNASASGPVYDTAKQAALMAVIRRYSGTPYIWGGDSPQGTDCSGLASWMANAATGRPIFGDRFDTATEESALLARGFRYGTAPGALVIGWNDHHTAVTLADGTPVASGEGGGVRIGGAGAYQAQFNHHMYLPMTPGVVENQPASPDAPAAVDGMDL
jgi:cell wall-associated NlpC family hydrolase